MVKILHRKKRKYFADTHGDLCETDVLLPEALYSKSGGHI